MQPWALTRCQCLAVGTLQSPDSQAKLASCLYSLLSNKYLVKATLERQNLSCRFQLLQLLQILIVLSSAQQDCRAWLTLQLATEVDPGAHPRKPCCVLTNVCKYYLIHVTLLWLISEDCMTSLRCLLKQYVQLIEHLLCVQN